jgi:hypothetical protein
MVRAMQLKPQDVLIVLKIVAKAGQAWNYSVLAVELDMSPAEVHQGVRRAAAAGLLFKDPRIKHSRSGKSYVPNRAALREFLVHGLRYVFLPEHGGETRGMPTAHAAPPLRSKIVQSGMPPVWPSPDGKVRGLAFSPLYRSAPQAAARDSELYELLALVDAVRAGQARERELARKEIERRLAA